MKRHILDFFRRGLTACWLGPIVLALIYLVVQQCAAIETLTVGQVCTGIFSLTMLAFLAGGMNFIYKIEKLPLMVAILIHGSVLYVGYLITYLINGWLEQGVVAIIVFSAIFAIGFFAIWAIIYAIIKKRTERLNAMLNKNRQNAEDISVDG